jgi:hypothetical protein
LRNSWLKMSSSTLCLLCETLCNRKIHRENMGIIKPC